MLLVCFKRKAGVSERQQRTVVLGSREPKSHLSLAFFTERHSTLPLVDVVLFLRSWTLLLQRKLPACMA